MKKIKEIDIRNKKVLIRVDYNIPLIDGEIKNTFRLDSTVDTINYCLSQNCSIILMTHIGRPKKGFEEKFSVYPIIDYLENKFNVYVHYSEDCISEESIKISNSMLPKEIHLLENLRFHEGEINNDTSFSEKLSMHANIYINDAFGTSHRSHASNSSILSYYEEKCIGLLMEKEFKYLSNTNVNSHNKCILVIGGSKISSKLHLLENFIDKASHILIGGAMAFTFLKAQGIKVGKSLIEDDMLDCAKKILNDASLNKVSIILPSDVACAKELNDDIEPRICSVDNIGDDEMGLDIGPETSMMYEMFITNSKYIIWNGPVGAFEFFNYIIWISRF